MGCGHISHSLHRRALLQGTFAGVTASVALGNLGISAEEPAAAALARQGKRVIFIWLAGGASQFEMWDPKPGRDTGGPFRTIATSLPGYHIGELMPRTATRLSRLAVIRSLSTGLSEHEQAADLISTGRPKEPALEYPELGVVLAKELAAQDSPLPDYVSLFTTSEGRRRPRVGFLGARHAPLLLEQGLRPAYVARPADLDEQHHAAREELRKRLSVRFAERRAGRELADGYNEAYQRVRGLMASDQLFDLEREPATIRDRYGASPFGQQCLLARRLVEAGVPMVKVARGFWDSHHDNFESHRELVPDFDHVFSVLLDDLSERGLLASTLVLVLSEFGRTPVINKDLGRDHYADAWSMVAAGCGIRGGTVYGRTDEDGRQVVDGPASAADLTATLYRAVGIDPRKEYHAGLRPVPLAQEGARPVEEVLA